MTTIIPLNGSPAAPTAPPGAAWRIFGQDLLRLTLLAALCVGVGLGVNRLRAHPLPWVYVSKADRLQASVARLSAVHPPTPSSPAEPAFPTPAMIDLATFHDLLSAKGTVVFDARPALFYQVGHVPGARSLARETFESDYARQRPQLEARRQDTLVVYCAGDACVDSRMVAAALQKLGYPHVLIFEGGWEEWQQAGLPAER